MGTRIWWKIKWKFLHWWNGHTLTVRFYGLTIPQKLALMDLFKLWEEMGGWGSSRWTAFYADGDGNFRPKVKVGFWRRKSKRCELGLPMNKRFGVVSSKEVYRMDFDDIAWAMNDELSASEKKCDQVACGELPEEVFWSPRKSCEENV